MYTYVDVACFLHNNYLLYCTSPTVLSAVSELQRYIRTVQYVAVVFYLEHQPIYTVRRLFLAIETLSVFVFIFDSLLVRICISCGLAHTKTRFYEILYIHAIYWSFSHLIVMETTLLLQFCGSVSLGAGCR